MKQAMITTKGMTTMYKALYFSLAIFGVMYALAMAAMADMIIWLYMGIQ